jgi:uncharacterized phage protein gp47/JayE
VSVEMPAAASPLFAWGWYLDQWALALGTERLAATYADGTVRFSGPNGTVVPEGTEVGATPQSSAADAPSYLTASDVTIAGGIADVLATCTEAGVVGNVPATAVDAILSDLPGPTVTVTNLGAMQGGTDEESDEALRERVLAIYGSSPGGGNVADYVQWTRTVPGVGGVSVIPEGRGPGTVVVMATTPTGDPVSDATRLAIRNYLDPPAVDVAISSVTANTITVPSTVGFRPSGIAHVGTMANERIHNYTGLSGTQLTGVTPAPTLTAGDHVWQTGRGGGRAPVGHHVVVGAAVAFNVTIAAVLELQPGYDLVDLPSSVNVLPSVEAEVRAYIDALVPGAEVVLKRIESVMLGIEGVYDLKNATINATAANVTGAPEGVPMLVAINLTEGTV